MSGSTKYQSSRRNFQAALAVFLLSVAALFAGGAQAQQQSEPSLPLSQRFKINLAAGVPQYIADATSNSAASQSQWWFEAGNGEPVTYTTPGFVESADPAAHWQQVGLPYDANVTRTFINQTSGGGQGSLGGTDHNWYRLHFKVDPKYKGQKFMLNLEGSHTGVQVYINGTLLPGISKVAKDSQATHVIGFVPVVVDLTPSLHYDGTDNVIAVEVSRGSTWFEQPNFSGAFRFGQAMAGLFRNVYLYVTNPIHIPLNVYSNQATWGTYVGTVSEVPNSGSTATAASAVVEVQTNVLNETAAAQQVTLTTQIVDASGNVVVTAAPVTQTVPAMTPATFPSTATPMFDQQITIQNPTLWYPNNSTYGKPYMYRVYHIVSVNGVVVDSVQSPLGIRTLTWDSNFPYFNGHAHYLWGASGRYDYPALGSSVPPEQEWRDLQQFAASGGNVWRPGHSTSSEEFVEAADAYGIMIDQPSGDGEGSWTSPSADDSQLKQEVHRDMIIRDRSHPSILDWEEDNGGNNATLAAALDTVNNTWDSISPRKQASRAYSPAYAFIDECDGAGCEVGNKNSNPQNPAFGAEYWDNVGTGRGLAWDNELAFAAPYLNDWRNGRANNTFGMAQWYFADTPGEVSLWSEFRDASGNPLNKTLDMSQYVRSLGYSMVDQNRFPRLLYYIYQANWTPYSVKPVVALAHHWNRAYEYTPGTPIQENAFSNCPNVRLLINGQAKDPVTGATLPDQVPNAWNVNSSANLTQSTTAMPGQVHWMVNWAAGTVTAQCLDGSGNPVAGVSDSRVTAGAENRIVLTAVPNVTRPDGTSFQWTANGSDAAFVTAQVVDANGNIVPTASDNVTFSVSGPASYMGGTQQIVADPAVTNYFQDAFSKANASVISGVPYAFFHAPGDPELNFEGGLQKIALRSTLTAGTVTVTASAPGLVSGSVTLASVPLAAPAQTQAPAIIVPPVDTAVTAGYPATFNVSADGSGTLSYQWYVNGAAVQGATGTSYTTPNTTTANNGSKVSVMVSSTSGLTPVTSNAVTLSVSAPANTVITMQPVAAQTAVVGQTATVSVGATGSPQLNYQWFVNSTPVQSGPQSSYTTPILTAAGTQTIYVIVSNPLNKVPSGNSVLTVNAPAAAGIATQPASQIVPVNQPVQLSATVTGSAPYTYQWQFTPKGGSTTILLSNTTSSSTITYTIPAMSAANVGAYTVTVNNAANAPATSAAAQITLAPPGVNLALGKLATTSSSQGACTDSTTAPPLTGVNCLGAENAVDGSLGTRWASASAGAPPATAKAGVDPSWLMVDLGTPQAFNTVVINWENAYAAQYLIQYTNADPTVEANWQTATTNNTGAGGTETLNFNTVQARYVRMKGTLRATQYGYSIYEFQVYNVPQCGGSTERYTVGTTNSNLVLDNLLGLTFTRTVKTSTGVGSQFTGVDAAAYCSSQQMRLPTQAEALSIAANNNASCAFPGTWNTWTSTVDPNDANETALVNFDGTSSYKVTNNWPGATLCAAGTFQGQVPVITAAPKATTVTIGNAAGFYVTATGVPAPSYQWMLGGAPIAGATEAAYFTHPTTAADNNTMYSVAVSNGSGTVTTTPVALTTTSTPAPSPTPTPTPTPTPAPVTMPTGTNYALHMQASASSIEGPQFSVAPNAVDGDTTTRWASAPQVDGQWLAVNLGSAQSVGAVAIRWENAYASSYRIEMSADGATWSPIPGAANASGHGGVEVLTFTPVTTQYIRMYGITRALQPYGYSLYEFGVYPPQGATGTPSQTAGPAISRQPTNQSAIAGSTATFKVVAGGSGPNTYQWLKGGTPISGATQANYTTPALALADNGTQYSVVVGTTSGAPTTTSTPAALAVSSYTVLTGFVGIDLNNETNGAWTNDQIYVTVIGMDPTHNNAFAYLKPDGTIVDFTMGDSTAPGALTKNGKGYGNYSFTLAQSTTLKMPTFRSARAYISLGAPLYVQVYADSTGKVNGYAGPNPQNGTDPNVGTHFDWYEFNNENGIFINTTQVDEFGLPLLLDVWGAGNTFHKQVGITESVAQLDAEFTAQVPAQFQPATMSDLRIFSPAKLSMAAGGANGKYFDSSVAGAWAGYANTPLSITVNGRTFSGKATGTTLNFSEVNPSSAHAGESFVVHQPSTQDILGCAGTMASGIPVTNATTSDENGIQLQLQNQICSAINRGVLLNPANWANAAAYYSASPANFYSQFWHNHSLGGFAYGYSYDDNNNQSTTITTGKPEHMTWGIGW